VSAKIPELVVLPQTAVIFLRFHYLFSGSPPEAKAKAPKPVSILLTVPEWTGLFWSLAGVEMKT